MCPWVRLFRARNISGKPLSERLVALSPEPHRSSPSPSYNVWEIFYGDAHIPVKHGYVRSISVPNNCFWLHTRLSEVIRILMNALDHHPASAGERAGSLYSQPRVTCVLQTSLRTQREKSRIRRPLHNPLLPRSAHPPPPPLTYNAPKTKDTLLVKHCTKGRFVYTRTIHVLLQK